MITTNYQTARDSIQDGDIVFIRDKPGILAKIIRKVTQSHYSHVGIAFWIEVQDTKRLMFAEAQGSTKRRILNLSFYSPYELDVVQSPKDWNLYYNDALATIGQTKYNFLEAVYVGLRDLLMKKFGIKLSPKKFDGEICSEYVAREVGCFDVCVSPEGLFEELINAGYPIKIQVR